MSGRVAGARGGVFAVACCVVLSPAAFLPDEATAQTRSVQNAQPFTNSGQAPASSGGVGLLSPGGGIGSSSPAAQTLAPPSGVLTAPSAAPMAPAAAPAAGQVALALAARYGKDFVQPINGGLVWRVYAARTDTVGKPLKEEKTATPTLALPPGDYVVHVTFGLASAVKTVRLRAGDVLREVVDIPAGGIRLEGRVGDAPIPPGQISFDVFRGTQFEIGDKRPLVDNAVTGDVVVVPEGTYSIVSNYGDSNSVVRSDIRVMPGKLTDVTVTHRAAVILLKLVVDRGGEALANTNWSVLTPGGDVVKESVGAFPRFILAEGDYRAIARNEQRTYERDFRVITGVDGEVEVLAR